ncbi:Pre-rRNA-processing protein ipi1 [Erysiphe neolycopersici]|uniref:Pre-rRNA-processing protein n=1 Tax=Erysiphe neolycopersici TaxID=212602 RepID=A0A420HKT3_9PEZI|nr:Pre-rRNA-processing protein ipi1 [Erysiphe neolycopersici]
MGSSARKKKENAKDFKKQKLRIGKTKAKPDNFTDTSFKSKSIVVNKQSLRVSAPSNSFQFVHYVSLASTSKNASQRKEALSFLISQIPILDINHEIPLPTSALLQKLLPLILDGSASVRNQLLKVLRLLPKDDIIDRTESVLLYVRAGMTHLSLEIRVDALLFLDWLLEIAQEQVVSCPGGWLKTLKCFMSIMGWALASETGKWSSGMKASFSNASKAFPKQLQIFAKFLNAGLVESEYRLNLGAQKRSEQISQNIRMFPMIDIHLHMIPKVPNSYSYLNLFGAPRDEDRKAYDDRQARQRVFQKLFLSEVEIGIEKARKEGGETGRIAATLDEILKKGIIDISDEF